MTSFFSKYARELRFGFQFFMIAYLRLRIYNIYLLYTPFSCYPWWYIIHCVIGVNVYPYYNELIIVIHFDFDFILDRVIYRAHV